MLVFSEVEVVEFVGCSIEDSIELRRRVRESRIVVKRIIEDLGSRDGLFLIEEDVNEYGKLL